MATTYRELLPIVASPSPVLFDVRIRGSESFMEVLRRRHPEWFKTLPSVPANGGGRKKPSAKKPATKRLPARKPEVEKPPVAEAPPAAPSEERASLTLDNIIEEAHPVIPQEFAIQMAGQYVQIPLKPAFQEDDAVVSEIMGLDPVDEGDDEFQDAVDPDSPPVIVINSDDGAQKKKNGIPQDDLILVENVPDGDTDVTMYETVLDDDENPDLVMYETVQEDDNDVTMYETVLDDDENPDLVMYETVQDDENTEAVAPKQEIPEIPSDGIFEIHPAYRDSVVQLFKTMNLANVRKVVEHFSWSPQIRRDYYLIGTIPEHGLYIYLVESQLKTGKFGIRMSKHMARDAGEPVGVSVSNLLLGLVINNNVEKLLNMQKAGNFDLKNIDIQDPDAFALLKSVIRKKDRKTELVRMQNPWGGFVNGFALEAEPVARLYTVGANQMLLGKAKFSNAFFLSTTLEEDRRANNVTKEEQDRFNRLTASRQLASYPVLSRAVFDPVPNITLP
jgi:hypothetical protein